MDPVIPADILLALFVVLIVAAAWAVLAGAGAKIAQRRQRLVEPETHGDDGGRPASVFDELSGHEWPKAPETGSGLPAWARASAPWKAGDMRPERGD